MNPFAHKSPVVSPSHQVRRKFSEMLAALAVFEMVRLERVDVVLLEKSLGLYLAHQMGIKFRVITPPLASVDFYMHPHKKHVALLEPIATALRAVKKDGASQSLVKKYLE